jgi:hypothetical protein
MKKLYTILIGCLIISNVAFSTEGPVTTAGSVTVCIGNPIFVPVTVADFNDIGGISLTLNYDATMLEYQDAVLNPAISGSYTNGAEPGVFILSYTCDPGINLDDNDTLFTLEFSYIGSPEGGFSALTWLEDNQGSNEYSTPVGEAFNKEPFEEYFIPGMITVDPALCLRPVTTAPDITISCPVSTIAVPVSVADFNNVGGISLTLNYNEDILQYEDVILNTAISGSFTNGAEPGVFILSFTCDPEIELDDDAILFTLEFNYVGPPAGGTSPLTWAESPVEANEYSDSEGNAYNKEPFEEYFIDGSVTINMESCTGPVTTAPEVSVTCPVSPIAVPVTVTDFNNIGGISLTLNYDEDILQYENVILNTAISGSLINGDDPGIFILSFTCDPEFDLDDDAILFTLEFSYVGPSAGGTSPLTWAESPPAANEYSDSEGHAYNKAPFDEYFIAGSVTVTEGGPSVVLTCPSDFTAESCQSQESIDASYAAWLATATVSGGVDPILTNNSTGAPSACGGSVTVTFTVTSSCEDPVTCDATFIVEPIEVLACPPASMTSPMVDGILDESYQFFKNVNLSAAGNNTYSRGTLYKFENENTLWLAYVESRGVNDNVYSCVQSDVSYAGWTRIHKFSDLLESDKVEIQLYNANSSKVFDIIFDYLFKQSVRCNESYNSGLAKFAPAGAMISNYDGSSSGAPGYNNVTAAETAQDYNQTCGVTTYTTKSPYPETGCWQYRIVYEVEISKAGLGLPAMITDTSKIRIPLMHNSPPKNATAINGYLYCDADNNGSRNPGEVGLGGWTINLAGPTNASTTTNANGYYEFFKVATGTYTLTEVAQSGYNQTQSPASFTVTANKIYRDKNFGNWPEGNAVELTCPDPDTVDVCQSQSLVDAAFAEWLATAGVTGGCNAVLTNDNTGAPPASGGTATVNFTATSCESPVTCQSSFTVRSLQSCPPASTTSPLVDGVLDASYQFFKNVNLSVPNNNTYSRGTLYKFENDNTLWLAYVESRGANDNVYGCVLSDVSYAGWVKIHKFSDLLSSDKVEIQLFNTNSSKVFDITFDYLFKQTMRCNDSYNSGLVKFAPSGAIISNYDGSSSNAPGYNNVTAAETAQDYNQTCGVSTYTTKSPYPETGCWEYRIVYEVEISKAGLGLPAMITDTSKIRIPLMHNSPPKNATAINGYLFCDADNSGSRNPGEVGLGGWTINLAGPTNASTTTNANGYYEFFKVATGTYTLTEVPQPGFNQTQSPATFTVTANKIYRDKNFGNWPVTCSEEQSAPDPSPVIIDSKEELNLIVEIVPNPFTVETEVRITSPVTTPMTVEIFNIQGIKIMTLYDGIIQAGVLNASRFRADGSKSSQIFVCVIRSQQGNVVKKIVRIR